MPTKTTGAAKRNAKGLPPIVAKKSKAKAHTSKAAPLAIVKADKPAPKPVAPPAPKPAPVITKTVVATPLSRKATLVAVVISQWTARKLDKKVTDEVNRSHGAAADAGRFNKLLIEAARLEKLGSLVSQARHAHYRYTKPWCDEGMRILPNALHQKFAEEFRRIKREFHIAADEFCRDYPSFVAERKKALNGLFNAADYPDAKEIRAKFQLDTKTFPVPDAGDFRSDVLDHDTIEDIKRELAETNEQVLADATRHSIDQITRIVGHMSEKLSEYKPGAPVKKGKGGKPKKTFFTDSLVENVRELADLLPAFNLTNDPKMDHIASRIKKELCTEDAAELRVSERARDAVQKSADDILKDVNKLLG